jgi:CubicO group peptidase (beta-lactamase class C family)
MKNIVKFILPLILVIAIPIILFYNKKDNELKQFDKASEQVFNAFSPTGLSIAIVKEGSVVYEKVFGYKNAETMDFMDNSAVFNIASCSKAFTAACIGKLVQEGLISWDDKVIDYIPEFKLADDCITNQMNIQDLLSHHSGLKTFEGDLLWYNTQYTNQEIISRMHYLPITRKFRSDYGYQNNMFMIAGEIIERITGITWEKFVTQNFFAPLEMYDTKSSNDAFNGKENLALPHYTDSLIDVFDFEGGKPAASIWSNPKDLANWVGMFMNDGKYKNVEILSPEIVKKLTSPQTILRVSEESESFGNHFKTYALGWYAYDYQGYKILEHDGSMPGYISKVAMIPEKKIGIIILNNGFDFYCNDALMLTITDIILGKSVNNWVEYYENRRRESAQYEKDQTAERMAKRELNTQPTVALKNFTGIYSDKMYGNAQVDISGEQLKLTLLPAAKLFTSTMEHWHHNSFKIVFNDPYLPFGIVTFEVDDKTKKVKGFTIDLPSSDFNFSILDFRKQTGI